jgi:hypothetical protein
MPSVIQEATQIVAKRGRDYGDPRPNHERIAAIWTVILGRKIEPHEVVLCMLGVKVARLVETPDHRDSMVDLCGYSDCLDIITGASRATSQKDHGSGQAVAAGHAVTTTIDGNGEISRDISPR